MLATDKEKLDSIVSGAEVNQNAFSNVTVGSTTIAASSETDTIEFEGGDNITLTPDATNKKVTIAVIDSVKKYSINNGALTQSGGICTWTIAKSSFGNVSGLLASCFIYEASTGKEVFADITHASSNIVIKINSSSNIAAGTYTAVIIA
jgi:hypothetical protein